MTKYRNMKGRFRTPTPAEKDVDIRTPNDVTKLQKMLKNGLTTIILIYADWCGHCHRYIPTWKDLENTPGRTANMARVHYDMQDKIPAIKDAKIQGYPSVIKVLPDGRLQAYASEGGATNAVPHMREIHSMQNDLQGKEPLAGEAMPQSGGNHNSHGNQHGGSVLAAFTSAIQQAGPAALLLLANSALSRQKRARTYRAPKRASRRAFSRKATY